MNDPTKTLVPPPPRAKRGLITPVPQPADAGAADNMQKANSGIQDMNFKVDPAFHIAFKMVSAYKGMPMRDLLEASFECWVDAHGDDTIKGLTAKLPRR